MEEKLLYKTTDEIEAIQIEGALKENNILFVEKKEGMDDYKQIMGDRLAYSIMVKIYVSEENYDQADSIIQQIINAEIPEDELPDELRYEEELTEEELKKGEDFRKLLMLIVIKIPLLIALIAVIWFFITNK